MAEPGKLPAYKPLPPLGSKERQKMVDALADAFGNQGPLTGAVRPIDAYDILSQLSYHDRMALVYQTVVTKGDNLRFREEMPPHVELSLNLESHASNYLRMYMQYDHDGNATFEGSVRYLKLLSDAPQDSQHRRQFNELLRSFQYTDFSDKNKDNIAPLLKLVKAYKPASDNDDPARLLELLEVSLGKPPQRTISPLAEVDLKPTTIALPKKGTAERQALVNELVTAMGNTSAFKPGSLYMTQEDDKDLSLSWEVHSILTRADMYQVNYKALKDYQLPQAQKDKAAKVAQERLVLCKAALEATKKRNEAFSAWINAPFNEEGDAAKKAYEAANAEKIAACARYETSEENFSKRSTTVNHELHEVNMQALKVYNPEKRDALSSDDASPDFDKRIEASKAIYKAMSEGDTTQLAAAYDKMLAVFQADEEKILRVQGRLAAIKSSEETFQAFTEAKKKLPELVNSQLEKVKAARAQAAISGPDIGKDFKGFNDPEKVVKVLGQFDYQDRLALYRDALLKRGDSALYIASDHDIRQSLMYYLTYNNEGKKQFNGFKSYLGLVVDAPRNWRNDTYLHEEIILTHANRKNTPATPFGRDFEDKTDPAVAREMQLFFAIGGKNADYMRYDHYSNMELIKVKANKPPVILAKPPLPAPAPEPLPMTGSRSGMRLPFQFEWVPFSSPSKPRGLQYLTFAEESDEGLNPYHAQLLPIHHADPATLGVFRS